MQLHASINMLGARQSEQAALGTQKCMAARGWKCVIADESHVMRANNVAPDARHTEAACAVMQGARRVIMLTGTPSLNRPFDLFRQVGVSCFAWTMMHALQSRS